MLRASPSSQSAAVSVPSQSPSSATTVLRASASSQSAAVSVPSQSPSSATTVLRASPSSQSAAVSVPSQSPSSATTVLRASVSSQSPDAATPSPSPSLTTRMATFDTALRLPSTPATWNQYVAPSVSVAVREPGIVISRVPAVAARLVERKYAVGARSRHADPTGAQGPDPSPAPDTNR